MINTEKRLKIVAAVRACIGTPWVHQARIPGRALDCIGLAIQAAKAAGDWRDEYDPLCRNYGRIPHGNAFFTFMRDHLVRLEPDDKLDGDLVLMAVKSYPMHVGVLASFPNGQWSVIHAMAERGGYVVEEPFTRNLTPHSWWRFPSLAAEEAG